MQIIAQLAWGLHNSLTHVSNDSGLLPSDVYGGLLSAIWQLQRLESWFHVILGLSRRSQHSLLGRYMAACAT